MAKNRGLFISVAILLLTFAVASTLSQDSNRLKGGRVWRGKPQSAAVNLDVRTQSGQTDNRLVVRPRGTIKKGTGGMRLQATLQPQIPSQSALEFEDQLTTSRISSTVGNSDEVEIVSSEPEIPRDVSSANLPVSVSNGEKLLETDCGQSELSTSGPMGKPAIEDDRNSEIPDTEINKSSKNEIEKSESRTPDEEQREQVEEDSGEDHLLILNSSENSINDSVEQSKESIEDKSPPENSLEPSTQRNKSHDERQTVNHADLIAKFTSRNRNGANTKPHSRPAPAVAVSDSNAAPKPRQSLTSRPTPSPSLPRGSRKRHPTLSLHPKLRNNPQVKTTPIPVSSHIQNQELRVQSSDKSVPAQVSNVQPKKRVQAPVTSVPAQVPNVQPKKRVQAPVTSIPVQPKKRVQGPRTSVTAHSSNVQPKQTVHMPVTSVPTQGSNVQPKKTVHMPVTSVPAQGSNVQPKKRVQTPVPSVPAQGSNVQQVKNEVQVSPTVVPALLPQVQTHQTNIVSPGDKPDDNNENVDTDRAAKTTTIPIVLPKTNPHRISNNQQSQEKKSTIKTDVISNTDHNISKNVVDYKSVHSPLAKARLLNIKGAKKAAKKSERKVVVKKRIIKLEKVDVKPGASSAKHDDQRISGASNAVAITSIALISAVTFMTIMGVYFKKISFSRKRYGQHILLSTQDDDLPLFNRETSYNDYEAPYNSWHNI